MHIWHTPSPVHPHRPARRPITQNQLFDLRLHPTSNPPPQPQLHLEPKPSFLFLSSEAPTPTKMPTPESASFQAKKPTVPPTYDGVDFEDNVAVHNARDAIIREQWVRSMMSRLVGEELSKCYSREGVNHLEKCGFLRGEWSFPRRHSPSALGRVCMIGLI